MKKILLALAIALTVASPSEAQVSKYGDYTQANGQLYISTLDTVSGTGLDTFFTQSIPGARANVSFQMSMTKIGSNTVAGNVVNLYGSTYNGGYVLMFTDTAKNQATQQFAHPITGNPYSYYMTTISGVSSQTSSWLGRLLLR